MDPMKAVYTYYGVHDNMFVSDFGVLKVQDQ